MQTETPYHLCPVCGMQSHTSSRICSSHLSIAYNSLGNIISDTRWQGDGRGGGHTIIVYHKQQSSKSVAVQKNMVLDIPEVKKPAGSPFGPSVNYFGSYEND